MILKEIKQSYKNKGIHKMQALQLFTSIYYINTCEIPGSFYLKNRIFIASSEDTIFIFHMWG